MSDTVTGISGGRMTQEIALKLNGLNTDPNPLGSVPQGALVTAENVVIDKQDVIELRRGFNYYGTELTLTGDQQLNSNYSYQNHLLVSYATTMAYDSDQNGTWIDFSGSYEPPAGAYKMRSFQQNKNFYFLTSEGVKKLQSYDGTIISSGVVAALGATATLVTGSFFTDLNQVAYRIVYGYIDSNGNLLLGPPSWQIVVVNNSGSAKGVQLDCDIPDGIVDGYFIQVYRSGLSGGLDIAPNDELGLVLQRDLTSGEISAKEVIIVDNLPDSQRGATLYTSPSQEGINQANYPPPLCVDACLYNSSVFYFNTTSKQVRLLTLLSTAVNVGTLSTGIGYFSFTGNTSSGVGTITAATSATTNIVVGQLVTGLGIPANTFVTAVDLTTDIITISNNASSSNVGADYTFFDVITFTQGASTYKYFASSTQDATTNKFLVSTTGDPAEDIAITALNFIDCFNLSANATTMGYYAYYDSNNDELPGQIVLIERAIGADSISVTCTKTGAFFPDLTTAASSAADTFPNYAYFSKTQQPEAVPILNFLAVGSADQAILRAIALKDSIVVMKGDGIFRITGADPTSFRVTLFDNTIRLLAPESAVSFNNQIYCYSNQGVVAINENGIAVISRPIESELLQLSSSNFPNFPSLTFGVSYESGRKYILYTVSNADDTYATQAFVFNSFTNTWTNWDGDYTYGIVNPFDDKLYFCTGNTGYMFKERKNYDIFDYCDLSFPVDIVSYDGLTVEVSDTTEISAQIEAIENIKAGFTLAQSKSNSAVIISVVDSTHILVSREIAWTIGTAEVYTPIQALIEWAPLTGGNPGIMKQFRDILVFFRQADFDSITIYFKSNFVTNSTSIELTPVRSGAYGLFPYGEEPWGGGPPLIQPIRTYFPLEVQRCAWVDISIEHAQAMTVFSLCGFSAMFNPVSTRMR